MQDLGTQERDSVFGSVEKTKRDNSHEESIQITDNHKSVESVIEDVKQMNWLDNVGHFTIKPEPLQDKLFFDVYEAQSLQMQRKSRYQPIMQDERGSPIIGEIAYPTDSSINQCGHGLKFKGSKKRG